MWAWIGIGIGYVVVAGVFFVLGLVAGIRLPFGR
jgi:hypothetical protein